MIKLVRPSRFDFCVPTPCSFSHYFSGLLDICIVALHTVIWMAFSESLIILWFATSALSVTVSWIYVGIFFCVLMAVRTVCYRSTGPTDILSIRNCLKMVRIDTLSNKAQVIHSKSLWYRAFVDLIRKSMCVVHHTTVIDLPVSSWLTGCRPFPTSSFFVNSNLFKESFSQCLGCFHMSIISQVRNYYYSTLSGTAYPGVSM